MKLEDCTRRAAEADEEILVLGSATGADVAQGCADIEEFQDLGFFGGLARPALFRPIQSLLTQVLRVTGRAGRI